MEEKYQGIWNSAINYLEKAALRPQQRDKLISCALQQLLHTSMPIIATALIWPCHEQKVPWKLYYEGSKSAVMHRWLSTRLSASFDVTVGTLQHDLVRGYADMPPPLFFCISSSSSLFRGAWIVWIALPSASAPIEIGAGWLEPVRQMLEAMLEVEEKETSYFSPKSPLYDQGLMKALVHGETCALAAFLSLARVVAGADLTFWASAYNDVVEVTSHLGAKNGNFGFALLRGHGMGGRVAASGKLMEVIDYRNYPYRDPKACDVVDSEQLRSGLALPIYYTTDPQKSTPVSAVLYVTRRGIAPFSQAERLLAQRQTCFFEQINSEDHSRSFFLSGGTHSLPNHKTLWHDLVLHANHIEAVEAWASQLIKGTVIVTNNKGSPYVLVHQEQLEQMQASANDGADMIHRLSLAAPGVTLPGWVYLSPSIPLPPPQWPDFFSDLVVTCNIVIARMERMQDQLDHQREQWLRTLLKKNLLPHIEQDGYRLGLPVEHGQIWVLIWPHGTIQATKSVRNRIIAETVVLDYLKSPLMFLEDTMGVVLLEGQVARTLHKPEKVRDALLKHCGSHPLWIVHGGHYHSIEELKTILTHMISLAQKARREKYEEYVLDIDTFGLDSLLENPKLATDLDTFARKLLAPLIEYDAANSAHLTETFVLTRALGSAQAAANQLGVHVNTIRYRLHRAEDILGVEQASPKEQAAMSLAAFTWLRFHPTEPG